MEFAIPFIALGGMYIISNRTNSEGFDNNDNENDNPLPFKKSEMNYMNESKYENNDYKDGNQTTDIFFDKSLNSITGETTSSLTGNTISKSEFIHNNMVPFFGSKIKGNYDNYKINESILDNMTGTGSQQKSKVESSPLFTPAENMQYPHGAPNMNDFYQSRINPSMNMSNVKPWCEERVAPGLNKGYSTEGTNGFNSALEDRESYMPKTVDELRVLTNPKESYCLHGHEGPLMSHITERGQFGAMEKHLPDTYYESGKERWFTTTGIESGQTSRSIHVNKSNPGTLRSSDNRTNTTQEYEGIATGEKHINYSKNNYTSSSKIELGSEQFTPANANNRNFANKSDYGKNSYIDYKNNRDTNKNPSGFGIMGSTVGAVIAPLIDVLRPSRKENVIGNIRLHGDIHPTQPKSYIKNQREIRTTNRQMNPNSLNHYNIQNQEAGAYEIANPNLVPQARDTTSIHYIGSMGGNGSKYGTTNYVAAYNQTNNDMKEATTYNRTAQGGTQVYNHLTCEHNIVKKENDRDNNRLWIPNNNPAKLPPSIESCGLTNLPNVSVENNRIESDLLSAFKENPYTHSLNSVA